ncbi:response regulator transcription factor [Natranaerobius trueperi]|uniref:Stage 0 sporulation protein A homolog n=1 Tax=Natranaerobius trueperi TaxID=759412 RepID=A0A226BZV5_9FIRM|nr:response regulator transcription factor [Natranaerobius trueperi]OWZ83874.1 DNA-binding response regulator [Natranaerobius trueperi]
MSYRINIVEDDSNLNSVLTSYLQKEGWEVLSFLDGESAQKVIETPPHLWILDIMLPDIDGFQLIKEIKNVSPEVPIIFISARDADIDRVVGLEMGSDDYLPKPFMPRELIIRAHKLLKRVYKDPKQEEQTPIEVNSYYVYKKSRTVRSGDQVIDLTSKEFDLLLYFIANKGHALSREQILDNIWGNDYFGTDRVVDDLVRRLRKKMPNLQVETIYGYGYRMVIS